MQSDLLDDLQRLAIRRLTIRLSRKGTMPGVVPAIPGLMADVLEEHGMEVEAGTGASVITRHPLGRLYELTPQPVEGGMVWSWRTIFDPVAGLRLEAARPEVSLFDEIVDNTAPPSVWWDGQTPIGGDYLGFDIETTAIMEGELPQVVLGSASSETGEAVLLAPWQIIPFLKLQNEKYPRQIWAVWNGAGFDLPTLEFRLDGFREEMHALLMYRAKRGFLYDAMLFNMLLDIGMYGELPRKGGLEPGQWAFRQQPVSTYNLGTATARWLDIDLPKGETLEFGDYIGREREITSDMASYALGDAMITAAIMKVLHRHPEVKRIALQTRDEMRRLHGIMLDFILPPDREPFEECLRLEGGRPLTDGTTAEYEQLVLWNGCRYGWQTYMIQHLGAWGGGWAAINGFEVDLEHVTEFASELETDYYARFAELAGQPVQRIVATDRSTGEHEVVQTLSVQENVQHHLRLAEEAAQEDDRDVTLQVVEIPPLALLRPFEGIIAASRHFPHPRFLAELRDPVYLVAADVTDDYNSVEAARAFRLDRLRVNSRRVGPLAEGGTRTGQAFRADDVIRWNGTRWDVLEGQEAADHRQRILEHAGRQAHLPMGRVGESFVEGEFYSLVTPTGSVWEDMLKLYIRECVFPLPPVELEDAWLSPVEQTRKAAEFYEALDKEMGLQGEKWMLVYGVRKVDDIPDRVLGRYFKLKSVEKELGAVLTYIPGYAEMGEAARRNAGRVPGLIRALGLEGVKRARVFPSYYMLGAATGRTAQRKPNLQQVKRDNRHRNSFVAAWHHLLDVADVGGTEMATSGEINSHRYGHRKELEGLKLLSDFLNEGYDTHMVTGMQFRFPEQREQWMPILGFEAARTVKMASTEEIRKLAVAELMEAPLSAGFSPNMNDSGEDIAKAWWFYVLARDVVGPLMEAQLPLDGPAFEVLWRGMKKFRDAKDAPSRRAVAFEQAMAAVKDARTTAKPVNFGTAGGMKAGRLAELVELQAGRKLTTEEAETAIQAWRTIYPDGAMWLDDGSQYHRRGPLPAPEYGYYDSSYVLTGRLRGQLPASQPHTGYDEGLNEWHNTQFQGLAADGAKLGLAFATEDGLRVSNFVHDELDYEIPKPRQDEYRQRAQDSLMRGMCRVLTRVRVSVGANLMDRWQKG